MHPSRGDLKRTALAIAGPAYAVEPSEKLADPVLEARARQVSQGLRCLVCQNESIDESHADLAHDVRVLLRERITAGDTDAQATAYIVSRYGEFVLLEPPMKRSTYLLWFSPLLLLGAATTTNYLLEYMTTYAGVTLHMNAGIAFGATAVSVTRS